MSDLKDRFVARAGLGDQPSLWEMVEAIREMPYGRPSERTAAGTVQEWRGTCSTKHALLAELLDERPEFELQLVHRVYRVDPAIALERFGPDAAEAVPSDGLVDVHTYAIVNITGEPVKIDVTFPGHLWDGRSDMQLACGPGDDYPVPEGEDPSALKEHLVREHCDPAVREPFIASLSA
ncbi:MAG: hypothetical protein WD826_03890 [Actinomycetota bacterium]